MNVQYVHYSLFLCTGALAVNSTIICIHAFHHQLSLSNLINIRCVYVYLLMCGKNKKKCWWKTASSIVCTVQCMYRCTGIMMKVISSFFSSSHSSLIHTVLILFIFFGEKTLHLVWLMIYKWIDLCSKTNSWYSSIELKYIHTYSFIFREWLGDINSN